MDDRNAADRADETEEIKDALRQHFAPEVPPGAAAAPADPARGQLLELLLDNLPTIISIIERIRSRRRGG